MELRNKKGERVLLYDRHMPETDDLAFLVLKGHLLVEEMLFHVAYLILPHPHYLEDINLSFSHLASFIRAAVRDKSEDACWSLIVKLNTLRNEFAHNLESPKVQKLLNGLFKIDKQIPVSSGTKADNRDASSLSDPERLRRVVQHCMEFLLSLDHSESAAVTNKKAAKLL